MNRFSHTFFILGIVSLCGMYSSLWAQSTPVPRTCPSLKNLVQDPVTQYWSAENNHWQSHSMSFANRIASFLGAQWNGSTVGSIYCLYRGTTMTFPIKLEFDTITPSPNGGKWSQDLGHFKNCISHNLDDCPFMALQQEKSSSLYQQLDSIPFKEKTTTEIGF